MPVQRGPRYHDTKLVGDIAVQQAILCGLQHGWAPLIPIGDRLPYDLVFDTHERLVRVQVKSAYITNGRWVANTRRAKTNRGSYKYERYALDDFDVAFLWHPEEEIFYVMPIKIFLRYKSGIALPSATSRRANGARAYREAWRYVRR